MPTKREGGNYERFGSVPTLSALEINIREYLERLIEERDRLYNIRFQAAETAFNAALTAQEKAVSAAFLASEKAIVKAEQAQKDYNERTNELRASMSDQAERLMSRPEALSMFKAFEDKIVSGQENSEAKIEGVRLNFEKAIDAINKDIVSLRESRSAGGGMLYSNERSRAQYNWNIGIIVAIIGSVISTGVAILALFMKHTP